MRIISGKYGGRRINLKAPDGIRPTMDNVRESIFNMLSHIIDFDGISVLELYSGSAIFSIECISRGAKFATCVDKSRKSIDFACNIIKQLDIDPDIFDFHQIDASKFLAECSSEYDLIFFDPPYIAKDANEIVAIIAERHLISADGIIVAEHSAYEELICPSELKVIKNKLYGDTSIELIDWA